MQKDAIFGAHMAGNRRKLQKGVRAQESRTLSNFHKIVVLLSIFLLQGWFGCVSACLPMFGPLGFCGPKTKCWLSEKTGSEKTIMDSRFLGNVLQAVL